MSNNNFNKQQSVSTGSNEHPPLPSPLQTTALLRHPNDVELNSRLQQSVETIHDAGMCENTRKAMEPKEKEYIQFCNVVYPQDIHRHTLTFEKVYRFMWFQSFREKRPRGGNKKLKQPGGTFDREVYSDVISSITTGYIPNPIQPIGLPTFDVYKATLRKMYRLQVSRHTINVGWEHIWQMPLDELRKLVKERAPRVKRETYQEKVTGEFAPYAIVERYGDIEQELWADSRKFMCPRSVNANLRHRYCMLHLTSGILRCKSLCRAELSDFLGLHAPKKDTDIHQIFVMINQIALGKRNKGRVLYGRAIRHKQVELCCIGALSFYLSWRFYHTKDFECFTLGDWMNNERWFDIKLLVNLNTPDNKAQMQKDTYGQHIKRVLAKLNINCSKFLHLGRNMGSKILDLLEEEAQAI